MAIEQANQTAELYIVRALSLLEGMPTDGGTWADAMVTRALQFIGMFQRNEIGVDALVWNLETIKKTKHEYSTHDESIKKEKVVEALNPLIDKLKGV